MAASGASPGFYSIFAGDHLIEHGLYISAGQILTLPAGTPVTVAIQLATGASSSAWQALDLQWSYWSSTHAGWWPLSPTPNASSPRC